MPCVKALCAQLRRLLDAWPTGPDASACGELGRIASEMRDLGPGLPPGVEDVLRQFYIGPAAGGLPLGAAVAIDERLHKSKIADTRTVTPEGCYLEFLKDHSSYTPLLPTTYHHCHGGGYFASLCGYGLVIDPGHRFLDNFYRAGHAVADIDGILVTHFHDDHYADLPALLSLLHARRTAGGATDLIVDEGTWSAFSPLLVGSDHLHVYRVGPACQALDLVSGVTSATVSLGPEATISFLPTDHSVAGFGLHLDVHGRGGSIVITSDTRWSQPVRDAYASLTNHASRVVVAHVSTAHPIELAALAGCDTPMASAHLGVAGTCQAARRCGAELLVLSEIGEELAFAAGQLATTIEELMGIDCEVATKGSHLYLQRNGEWSWPTAARTRRSAARPLRPQASRRPRRTSQP